MINSALVFNRLKEITTLDDDGAATSLPLCSEVSQEFSQKLIYKDDESNPLVIYAAAAVAFYRLMLIQCMNDDGTTQFKAGDVSVTKSSQYIIESAQKLKDDALFAISDCFRDDDFVFRQVES